MWDSKNTFSEWEDLIFNAMENYSSSNDKHTPIVYLIWEDDNLMLDADLPDVNSQIDIIILQVSLDGLDYQEDNKDLFEKLF